MGYIRGKPLAPGEKRAIVCVKGYFDRNRKELGLSESRAQLTADALEVSISTWLTDKTLLMKINKLKDFHCVLLIDLLKTTDLQERC